MSEDILGYLESKGLQLKRASVDEVHTACFFCNEESGKRGRLYINVDDNAEPPALFHCKLCDERGALNKIKKHFGDPIHSYKDEEFDERTLAVLGEACKFYEEALWAKPDAVDWLKEARGLDEDTIKRFRLGWGGAGLLPHLRTKGFSMEECKASGLITDRGTDFHQNYITIPYLVQGKVVSIRGKDPRGKYRTPPGTKARLFNTDATWSNEEIVVCEGEFDAMILEQNGFSAVGAPGATTWQATWTPYFKESRRVFVCFDPDDAGVAGAERVSSAIGPKARIVALPEDSPGNDISDWFVTHGHTSEEFAFLLSRSKTALLVSVRDAYDEWLRIEGNPNLAGIKMGIETLDHWIKPGILPGQVMILLAKTGTGKTIFTLNMFHRMCMEQPDLKILFVSLEQTRNEWFERARRIHRFYDLDSTEKDVLDWWSSRLMLVDKNRVTEDELVSSLEGFEAEMGQLPDFVAVDYLGYWSRSYKGESYERTSAAIMAMKAVAKETKIPFFSPHQVSRGADFGDEPGVSDARDSGVVEETADFLFSIWSPDQRKGKGVEDRTGEVNLKIGKSRHGGVGVQVKFQFAPLSLAMVPIGDPAVKFAKDENDYAMKGDTFDIAIWRHKTGKRDLRVTEEDIRNGTA